MKVSVFSFLLFFVNIQPAFSMSWLELESEINVVESGGKAQPSTLVRLSEIVSMLVVMVKAEHDNHPEFKLLCPPRGKSLDLDGITSLMRQHVKRNPSLKETSVQEVLLATMRAQFPC